MKYLPVFVLSNSLGDSTNNGISATHERKLVVPCLNGHITADDVVEMGYKVLELRPSAIAGYPSKFAEAGETRWTMFGGNYVTSSDSRFSANYGHSPIAIHDRIEGK
tara:strand:- start:4708 stop:5028 length:321 start_codon:yes stop_codon:yes gene_type:complete